MIKVSQKKIEALEAKDRINELKALLDSTDHKEFLSYVPKVGEDLQTVIDNRVEWRQEIRDLELVLSNEA